jgi:pilus assembly protein CpaE
MMAVLSCEKQADRAPLRQLMLNSGVECGADDVVVYDELVPRLNRGGAELLVMALGDRPQAALPLLRQIHEQHDLPILVLGPGDDAQVILEAMQAGAREFVQVHQPQIRERLIVALEKMRRSGAIQIKHGRSIVVTGAVPGGGVTTVAAGLAFALAVRFPQQVLLSELEPGVPELALDLDLKPRNTMEQLLNDWQRIDAAAVKKAALEHEGGVFVLAAGDAGVPAPAEAGSHLIALARTIYDHAVYDLGHGLKTQLAQRAAQLADRVVVVVRLDVPSLRLTHLLLDRLADLGLSAEKLALVANRQGQRKQVGWKQAESAVGRAINVWLPDDPATVNQALNLGQPVTMVSRWGKMNRRLNALVELVTASSPSEH